MQIPSRALGLLRGDTHRRLLVKRERSMIRSAAAPRILAGIIESGKRPDVYFGKFLPSVPEDGNWKVAGRGNMILRWFSFHSRSTRPILAEALNEPRTLNEIRYLGRVAELSGSIPSSSLPLIPEWSPVVHSPIANADDGNFMNGLPSDDSPSRKLTRSPVGSTSQIP